MNLTVSFTPALEGIISFIALHEISKKNKQKKSVNE